MYILYIYIYMTMMYIKISILMYVIFIDYASLMFMLGLNETIDQMAMENSVLWYGHLLRREDGLVLRRALDFEVEGQRKKGRLKRTW